MKATIVGADGDMKGLEQKTSKERMICIRRKLENKIHTVTETTGRNYASEHTKC